MKAQNKYLLCDDLINLLTKFKISLTKFADEYGLTAVQVHALYILDQQGSVATGKVANALHCDASNVTGIVERLVTSGLVERHEDPDDRRAKKLQLSVKGKHVIKQFSNRLPDELGINTLHADQIEAAHEVMQIILDSSKCEQQPSSLTTSRSYDRAI